MAQNLVNHNQSISDNVITNAKLRDSAALSVIGRSANSTGDPADIAGSTINQVLKILPTTTTLGFGDHGVIDRVGALDIVNTLTETSTYSYSIPANTLGTNHMYQLKWFGDYLNVTAANRTIQLKVKYGGTTLFDDTSGNVASNAVRHNVTFDVILFADAATNAQRCFVTWEFASIDTPASGLGGIQVASSLYHGSGSSAEDSTGALTFDVTITHSTNSSNLSLFRRYAHLSYY